MMNNTQKEEWTTKSEGETRMELRTVEKDWEVKMNNTQKGEWATNSRDENCDEERKKKWKVNDEQRKVRMNNTNKEKE